MLDVIALGAVCEMEDLTAPPRQPKVDGWSHLRALQEGSEEGSDPEVEERRRPALGIPAAMDFGGGVPERVVFGVEPLEDTMADRRRMLESGQPSFYTEEFADLSDGRRVLLKDDRGWNSWPTSWDDPPSGSWKVAVGRALAKEAILILDPDEDDDWTGWVADRLRFLGVDADPASVQAAPFQIEFGPCVHHELRQRGREFVEIGHGESDTPLSVVALGAVCELAYLTDPPRRLIAHGRGYAYYSAVQEDDEYPTPEELGAAGPHPGMSVTYGSYFEECSPEEMQAQRWEMFESGMRELYAVEFADLSDGRRVVLKDDRAWDYWPVPRSESSWRLANGRDLTRQVIMMLDPHHTGDWMDWVLDRLRSLGVDADPASVHAAPFRVEFSPRVQHELRQPKPEA